LVAVQLWDTGGWFFYVDKKHVFLLFLTRVKLCQELLERKVAQYRPYQFPEKLISLMINNCLKEKDLPVYGDGMQVRDWLHVSDHCSAIVRNP
jgi:hypothetical protein